MVEQTNQDNDVLDALSQATYSNEPLNTAKNINTSQTQTQTQTQTKALDANAKYLHYMNDLDAQRKYFSIIHLRNKVYAIHKAYLPEHIEQIDKRLAGYFINHPKQYACLDEVAICWPEAFIKQHKLENTLNTYHQPNAFNKQHQALIHCGQGLQSELAYSDTNMKDYQAFARYWQYFFYQKSNRKAYSFTLQDLNARAIQANAYYRYGEGMPKETTIIDWFILPPEQPATSFIQTNQTNQNLKGLQETFNHKLDANPNNSKKTPVVWHIMFNTPKQSYTLFLCDIDSCMTFSIQLKLKQMANLEVDEVLAFNQSQLPALLTLLEQCHKQLLDWLWL